MSTQQAIPASGNTAENAAALRDSRPHPLQPSGEFTSETARVLADELRHRISGEVRFDEGSRALYATDGSNYRQVPIGVVVPRTLEDIVATVAVCRERRAPVLARGGGTSLAGQCCNTAVVMDMSKYLHRVLAIDPEQRQAVVEPGCVLDELRLKAEQYHLTFGPDPATHDHNTLGGMIGNNSCGIHSVMAGRTADNVEELEILTYDGLRLWVGPTPEAELEQIIRRGGRRGEIYAGLKAIRDNYADLIRARYPKIPRRVSGYNLDELLPENGFNVARALVGSEGTCVTVLQAKLRLVHSPPVRVLLVLGYPDVYSAGDHVPKILEYGPVGLEGIDHWLIEYMKKKHMHPEDRELLPEGGGWLLVEFGGETEDEAVERARKLSEALQQEANPPNIKLFDDSEEAEQVWEIRESALGATARVPGMPDTWPGWEDAAVPPERVGQYLRDFRALLKQYDYACSLYGHFGDGCIHVRIDFDLVTDTGIQNYLAFTDEAADLVMRYGGSFSGEHGDGQARAELLPKLYGEELVQAFREFKSLWDPLNRMNPGKVVDPFRRDENLRLGADYHPSKVATVFAYPDDNGSFSKATLRCVGVGKCRHINKGVMCPSYMATREEMHSTRGRAHLLFEMLQGDPLNAGWKSQAVHEALELCLACKGCKGDCPINVDMATYKAEFNYHYYKGRLRPRTAYSMGWIYWWSRLAALAPGVANFVGQTPGLGDIGKWLGGIAKERQLPAFAPQTFRHWYRKREVRNEGRPKVMLWPDTFNNHLHPETLMAAVEVLEAADYQVIIPERSLCCARPLYDWGMLDPAKKQLRNIMRCLANEAFQGTPIVGLEPACVAAFRDELINLFPEDERAQRLNRQTFMLSEFLADENYQPPHLNRKALVHAHCNHHAILNVEKERKLLSDMGLDYDFLKNAGCCGMAGAFGFAAEHYAISMKIGERILLPAVRHADPDTLIITSGYSCREQIAQATHRQPLHVAEVLQMALTEERAQ
jgi:FAD/FMN-containing dehydrogenase/Fe-S oxidoreductase